MRGCRWEGSRFGVALFNADRMSPSETSPSTGFSPGAHLGCYPLDVRNIYEFLAERPTGTLYHYTDAAALVSIITKRELWATNAHHLNDAGELRYGLTLLKAEVEKRLDASDLDADAANYWADMVKEWEKGPQRTVCCVVSFSTNGNQLSQWRAYCPHGNGYSIGFSLTDLQGARKATRALMVKCVYEPDEQRDLILAVASYLENVSRRAKRLRVLKSLAFLATAGFKATAAMLAIKDRGFKEESEWRLVVGAGDRSPLRFRSGRYGVLPYCVVPLCDPSKKPTFSEIYIGPNPEPDVARDALVQLLDGNAVIPVRRSGNTVSPRIENSGIPFRY
jgi:hypothetical protein